MDREFESSVGGDKFKFFFILDRSGSMGSRISIALQALDLFLMSLPKNCGFQIMSFGSEYQWLNNNSSVIPYNDETLQQTKAQIKNFRADFGGTEIHKPLEALFR